jgi:hypothetical protein
LKRLQRERFALSPTLVFARAAAGRHRANIGGAVGIGQQPVMTDAMKAKRQDVEQEARMNSCGE